jgi:hypothetical protein
MAISVGSGVIMSTAVLAVFVNAAGAEKTEISVRIVDRQIHDTVYTYVLPAQFASQSSSTANCSGTDATVNCSGRTTTTGTATPARSGFYNVKGATFSLQLPDGRIAVVNCDSKAANSAATVLLVGMLGGGTAAANGAGNRRNCRIPLVDDIRVEFDGDKAKLKWPVSIDGKKIESESYKVLGILGSGQIGFSSTRKAGPGDKPVIQSTGDAAALELADSTPVSRTTAQATGQEAISTSLSSIPAKTVVQSNVVADHPASGLNNVAEIIVASNPAGATVEISGNAVGTTPVTLRFAANGLGFNLYVQKDGYRKWYIQTFAAPGRQVITADLRPEAPIK